MKVGFSKELIQPTYRAGILQSKAYRALNTFMNKALAKYGLPLPQWAALGVLHDEKELRPSSLSEILGIKPPVATRLLNALESKGLALRATFADDSRGTIIRITPQGSQLISVIEKQLRSDMRAFMSDVRLSELVVYIRVLSKLARKL